jgi:Ca2+:H+ antiporter
VFSLKTHRELFVGADDDRARRGPWPMGLALVALGVVTVLVALVSHSVRRVGAARGRDRSA